MHFFDYASTYLEDGQFYKGLSYTPSAADIIGTETVLYTYVKANEIYRPDKIAQRLWGYDDSWVLDILNNFNNGIKEYTLGTRISYISKVRMRNLGLL